MAWSPAGSAAISSASAASSAPKAPSTATLPSGVSRTSTPRRSRGIGQPLDEVAAGEAVDAVGHGAAGHQRLAQETTGRQLVRRTGAPQRRQHVELPRLDVVGAEGVAAGEVEVAGQPADPAEHLDRAEVEVAALAGPRLDQAVHFVAHGAQSVRSVENLDIEIDSEQDIS